MKLDMHCHTAEGSSDAKVGIEKYIESLKSQGFDGMLVTDHDSYDGYRYYDRYLQDKIRDFVVLKSIEYDTLNAGHVIVILPDGVELKVLEHKGLPVEILIKIVHRHGGILGPAHPCGEPFLSIFSTGRFKKDYSIAKKFDFIEAYNCGEDDNSNQKAHRIADRYNKPVTGGSDSHKQDCIGLAYTVIDRHVRNNDELIAYIKGNNPTECGGTQYMGTIKEHLGVFNKLLVYGFFPYNKLGALWHYRKRKHELEKIMWEIRNISEERKRKNEILENTLKNRYTEFTNTIESIINNDKFMSMKNDRHHAKVSTHEHCEHVAATCEKLARILRIKHIDKSAMLHGALLHDFYLYDWHKEDNGEHKWHGYHHADKACKNAVEEFEIGPKEQSIIYSHMWPLNITRVPRSREAWIVCIADKYVSAKETLFRRKDN